MTNKKVDRNARHALDQFKYEMADELGLNQINSGVADEKGNFNIKKLAKSAKNRMKRR